MGLEQALAARRALLEKELDRLIPAAADDPLRLVEATRYGLLGPGKRLRGCIVTWACEAVAPETAVEPGADVLLAAAAIECLHAYTLVHDDLPAMDDDDERRGRPTVHKAFDEATAILAGDALLTIAFEILSGPSTGPDPAIRSELVLHLARASGWQGMVLGQALDLNIGQTGFRREDVSTMQALKTGALFRFACEAGAILGRASASERAALIAYAAAFG